MVSDWAINEFLSVLSKPLNRIGLSLSDNRESVSIDDEDTNSFSAAWDDKDEEFDIIMKHLKNAFNEIKERTTNNAAA